MKMAKLALKCTAILFFAALGGLAVLRLPAQTGNSVPSQPAPVPFTAQQDRQNMMQQLGIRALRPGPSGNENAPNHANYDESVANPYPNLPDALTLSNGEKVTTAQIWWQKRRPEIAADYERYVYGRIPANVPKVVWSASATDKEFLGRTPVIAKTLIGHVDNSSYPLIDVNIRMTLVTPAGAKGPVPILLMFGRSGFPAPSQPTEEQRDTLNAEIKALLVREDPSLEQTFAEHPGFDFEQAPAFRPPQLNADGDPPSEWEIVADGWGFATIDPASIQADNAAGLTRGIVGLVNKGQPRTPEDWGALRAWAWGAGWTIWRPILRWTQSTLASKAFRDTARRPS